jgi:hypothetical protein
MKKILPTFRETGLYNERTEGYVAEGRNIGIRNVKN